MLPFGLHQYQPQPIGRIPDPYYFVQAISGSCSSAPASLNNLPTGSPSVTGASADCERPCGLVRVRLFVFDLSGEALARIGPRAEVRAWRWEWTGVSIYRDGFRVWPHAEPHGSWNRSGYRRRIAIGPFDAPTREAGTAIRKGHPTGVATLHIDKSPGDRLRRADELDVEGVDPEGLVRHLTDHGMNDAVGFSDPLLINERRQEVQIPLAVFVRLDPAGRLDRKPDFGQTAEQFLPIVDLCHHQWNLIHRNTPCLDSVIALYSARHLALAVRS
jgi:hypothetical protein